MPTQFRITSLHLRIMLGESGCPRSRCSADPFRRKGNGRKRILDLVGHALRHFLPCQLPLGAQQFGGVFDHQNGSLLAAGQIEPRAGHSQVHGPAAHVQFNLGGSCAHPMTATDHGGEFLCALGRQQQFNGFTSQLGVIAQSHQRRKCAVGLQHRS